MTLSSNVFPRSLSRTLPSSYKVLVRRISVLEFLGGTRTEQDIIAVMGVFSTWTSLQLKPFAETSSIETWEVLDIFDRLRESPLLPLTT